MFKNLFLIFFFILFPNICFGTKLILINGSSCSGKSTLCSTLFKHVKAKYSSQKWELKSIDQYFIDISDREEDFESSLDSFHSGISKKLDEGTNIILDHSLMHDEIFQNALYHFKNHEVFFIKVFTTYEKACERLKTRNEDLNENNHRDEKSFQKHYGKVQANPFYYRKIPCFSNIEGLINLGLPTHLNKHYDLKIDTTNLTPDNSFEEITKEMDNAKNFIKHGFYDRHIDEWKMKKSNFEFNTEEKCWVKRDCKTLNL